MAQNLVRGTAGGVYQMWSPTLDYNSCVHIQSQLNHFPSGSVQGLVGMGGMGGPQQPNLVSAIFAHGFLKSFPTVLV